jgi:octanoyl-[GcvH]:protein N-octanoyltransferase
LPTPLRLHRRAFQDDPALDVAVSRAILNRVATGELPETLRLTRPPAMVAFGRQDVAGARYLAAVRAAREGGFEAIERLAGGRAAVFHEGTLAIAHVRPDSEPQSHIYPRFEEWSGLLADALERLGVDAGVGEVPGEYCPGAYSVHVAGRSKVAGIAQRVVRGGALTSAVVTVGGGERIRAVVAAVYAALGIPIDPALTGALQDADPGLTSDAVQAAVIAAYARGAALVPAVVDGALLARADALRARHAIG